MKDFALITGASKGIGKCFAQELASKGYNLVLVARSASLIEELAIELKNKYSIQVEFLSSDLSDPSSPEKVLSFCESKSLPVSILINNAGYGLFGEFESISLDSTLNMLRLNMLTLVSLCHLFIPYIKKQEKGYILNVASTAAYQSVPLLNAYSASKAFVLSFSRALSFELKNSTIHVSCLCPGSTKTDFMDRAGMENPKILATAEKLGMSAVSVAQQGLSAMFKGVPEYIPGFGNWIGAFASRFLPKILVERIAASLYKD